MINRIYGLIGFPLTHSFSQKFFTGYFEKEGFSNCEYRNFPIENPTDLRKLIGETPDLCGLNVTIPHKINVMELLDEIDDNARLIGSVNTIKVERKDGKILLTGFNTDEVGFSMALKPLLRSHHFNALILGNGGSSKTVQFVLKKLGISFKIITRNPKNTNEIKYENLSADFIRFHPLIINTTPVGMFPDVNQAPGIPYEGITNEHLLFDLIYNPEESLFLKNGKQKGAQISNGLTMLHQQALAAWEIWNK